ncbi:DUF6762 family protein [Clostridium polynesiense]|uniref:DUF6762 family protein n=1 Tax=Clostridium polynesiense TaxID=1325933 RepID=UPI00058D2EC4|nr:DUF6762 family protein [Clostridium polynesiense]
MEFSSLVLMEVDPIDKKFIKEIGSFSLSHGGEYVKKFYCHSGDVFIIFDINKDVEDWEYSAIFDLFEKEDFINKGFKIEDVDSEFNPAWIISFPLMEEREDLQASIEAAGELIEREIHKVLEVIKGKKEEYQ